MDIKEYIKENLPKTVRYQPTDDGPLFALPKPFTVPCADGMFQEMYHWDSYFTNIGLIDDGNMEHTCHLCEKYNVVEGNANATPDMVLPLCLVGHGVFTDTSSSFWAENDFL